MENPAEPLAHQRQGLLFREKPFYIALLYPRTRSEQVRELALNELLYEHVLHNTTFSVKELTQ